jgi:hypothetical protein
VYKDWAAKYLFSADGQLDTAYNVDSMREEIGKVLEHLGVKDKIAAVNHITRSVPITDMAF